VRDVAYVGSFLEVDHRVIRQVGSPFDVRSNEVSPLHKARYVISGGNSWEGKQRLL
jgi:hypothetical protein